MTQLKVQFFASLRERLGRDHLDVHWPEQASAEALIKAIAAELGAEAGELLNQDEILIAVNQTMVGRDHLVDAGDEVAFLPPVTGG